VKVADLSTVQEAVFLHPSEILPPVLFTAFQYLVCSVE